jgi:hypothetical protein
VVGARSAVDDEGDRSLAHARPVRHQAHAIDVKVDFGVADSGSHVFYRPVVPVNVEE